MIEIGLTRLTGIPVDTQACTAAARTKRDSDMDASLELSDEELDYLDDFLVMTEEGDVPTLSELDGFLTAAAFFPESLEPAQRLEAIFGEGMSCFDSKEQGAKIVGLVSRRYNHILVSLRSEPSTYLPVVDEDSDGSPLGEIWAEGFARCAALRPDPWTELMESEAGLTLLLPLMALGDPEILARIEPRKRKRSQLATDYSEHIATYVIGAYRLARMTPLERAEAWAEMQEIEAEAQADSAATSTQLKVGRNEPCPCGSGKKFKRCCGASI
jgi:uncharacterized protein